MTSTAESSRPTVAVSSFSRLSFVQGIDSVMPAVHWLVLCVQTPYTGCWTKLSAPGPWILSLSACGECLPYADNRVTLDPERTDRWGLPLVRIDYKQISYCVKTIASSTLSVMNRGGELRVETLMDGDAVLLRISDSGKPLSKKAQEALTAPFYQTQEMGAGVGLSLCKIILERQGSTLSIISRPGGGNTYSIRLSTKKENI